MVVALSQEHHSYHHRYVDIGLFVVDTRMYTLSVFDCEHVIGC